MTEEQLKNMRSFEVRVHQILQLCDKLRIENANFKSQLEELRGINDSLKEENSKLKIRYDNLKIARMISVSKDDFKATKERLSNLVLEVDKCIVSLNK